MILIIKHINIEGPGTLGEFLRETKRKTKIVELNNNGILPSLDECEAVISLGGPMNVYEEEKYPFLKDEHNFLCEAVEREIPILGICLGAQLLAKACQAKVNKAKHKEIGWYDVELSSDGRRDPLFAGLPEQLNVFQWHEDTFDIPAGAVRLAESSAHLNQAFRFGKNAYGLQFHIEVTPPIIESWIKAYVKRGSAGIDTKKILREAKEKKAGLKRQAGVIYRNLEKII